MTALFRIALLLAALVTLGSCTTLTTAQCQSGDWRQIGIADGAEGYGPDRLTWHRRTCGRAGVVPDGAAWTGGREEGLRRYCTPANAYSIAREGRPLREGCTPAEITRLQPAYDWGRKYWDYELRIRNLRHDIHDARRDWVELPPGAPDRAFLPLRRMTMINEIRMLERQQRRYATWP